MSPEDVNAIAKDKTLLKSMEFVQTGRWYEIDSIQDPYIDINELKELRSVCEELACHPDNVLLRGNRIVLPTELRHKAVSLAHEGHQGMSRSKTLIRSKLWFPGLNERVENVARNCLPCQSTYAGPPSVEPLNMSKLPDGLWQKLSIDFCRPLPTGEHLLVITDEYSRYPVVKIVNSVSTNTTILVIDKVLSIFSYPQEIKSDNGSPLTPKHLQNLKQTVDSNTGKLPHTGPELTHRQNHSISH